MLLSTLAPTRQLSLRSDDLDRESQISVTCFGHNPLVTRFRVTRNRVNDYTRLRV